ncbi:MAG: hypothetical protein JO041_01155 [Acidobacteria bacterium]|nr:hypothetical protein [Acidobacteriota bacterium]
MPEPNDLDRKAEELLDRALANYPGEPLAGLENRTLTRLRMQQQENGRAWLARAGWATRIAAATAAVAALAMAVLVGVQIGERRADAVWQQRTANGVWNSVKPAENQVTVAAARVPASTTTRAMRHHAGREQKAVPSTAQFPSPAPLSPEERVMARLAGSSDPGLLASLAQATQPSAEQQTPPQ